MSTLIKLEKIWSAVEVAILSLSTLIMSALVAGNAISRYVFNASWGGAEEVGKLLLIIMTFIGLGYAARRKMHIDMSGFYDILPARLQWCLRLLINSVTAVIMLYLAYLGYRFVGHLYNNNQLTAMLRMPVYLFMLSLPIGFFFAFVSYLIEFIKDIKNWRHVEKETFDEKMDIELDVQ